jgi:hypothetical protein
MATPAPTDLSADAVIAAARDQTGLTEFRDDFFVAGLEALTVSIRTEAGLHDAGLEMQFQRFVSMVANRLMADRLFVEHPEILEAPLGPMTVITGIPRTGTTKVQRIAARHPDVNYVASWLTLLPVPLQGDKAAPDDARLALVAEALALQNQLWPELKLKHELTVHEPEEDNLLMHHSLHTMTSFDVYTPSYTAWLANQDVTRAYEDLADYLRLVQWQNDAVGRPWILKNVLHLHDLATLCRVFPKTRIVWAHRDPGVCIASWSSLVHELRRAYTDTEDPVRTGQQQLAYWSHAAERGVQHRAALGEDRFLDVAYDDIVTDMADVLRAVLEFSELDASAPTIEALCRWEAENPQHKHGRHEYSMAEFGLTATEVEVAFAAYFERFPPPT